MQVFMVVEKSSEARPHAPSPIRRPLNPGGQTARLRLLESDLSSESVVQWARHKEQHCIASGINPF